MTNPENPDHIDRLQAQWATQLPSIDTSPMSVLGRVNRIAHLTEPAISTLMDTFNLDRGEFDVLATLRRAGSPFTLTPTELYTSLMLSSGGLSNRLNRMKRKGLIGRSENKSDGRSHLVQLSKKGLALVDKVFAADMALEKDILSHLNNSEFVQLETALRMLCQSIEKPVGKE